MMRGLMGVEARNCSVGRDGSRESRKEMTGRDGMKEDGMEEIQKVGESSDAREKRYHVEGRRRKKKRGGWQKYRPVGACVVFVFCRLD